MKQTMKYFLAIFLGLLVFSMPICFAAEIQNTANSTQINNKIIDTNKLNAPIKQSSAKPPVLFAGLALELAWPLIESGITYIGIGCAAILGSIVVVHVASTSWVWYNTKYAILTESAYKHTQEFKDILGNEYYNIPGKSDRSKISRLCKDIINKKSKIVSEYSTAIQGKDLVRVAILKNGRYISVIGKDDGKTIYHCSPDNKANMIKKFPKEIWKAIDGFMKTWK